MATCCGRDRASRFCPDCGKALGDAPLLSLLAHLRKTEAGHRTAAANHRESVDLYAERGTATQEAARETWAADADRKADKWKAWADALAALIAPPP